MAKPEESLADSPLEKDEILKEFFPEAYAVKELPSGARYKAKVVELHEQGRTAEAAKLMGWWEEATKKVDTKAQKYAKRIAYVLVVITVLMAALWYFYGKVEGGSSLVVCSINGETFEGKICLDPPKKDKDIKDGSAVLEGNF